MKEYLKASYEMIKFNRLCLGEGCWTNSCLLNGFLFFWVMEFTRVKILSFCWSKKV